MQLFDAYLMVDWSAGGGPRRGADAIWYGLWTRSVGKLRCTALENPSTRDEATAALTSNEEADVTQKQVAGICTMLSASISVRSAVLTSTPKGAPVSARNVLSPRNP